MMRICSKCGDFFGDKLLGFCPNDGAPLRDVDPSGDKWSEGARVIEKKANTLRKQQRWVKWRRLLVSGMTLVAVMMILYLIADGFVYYTPIPPSPSPSPSSSPAPTLLPSPMPSPSSSPSPSPSVSPSASPSVSPRLSGTPSPSPSVSVSPRILYMPSPSPSVSPRILYMPSPSPSASPRFSETPSRSPSPRVITRPSPSPRPGPTRSSSPAQTFTPKSECSKAEQRLFSSVRHRIEAEKPEIARSNVREGYRIVCVNLGSIKHTSVVFFKGCESATVTARYEWQVKFVIRHELPTGMAVTPQKVVVVKKERFFACNRTTDGWNCNN